MVGWHHQLNGHEFEQALGVGDGQGILACCSPWGRKESDTTEQQICIETTPKRTDTHTHTYLLDGHKREPTKSSILKIFQSQCAHCFSP